jgi:hypothetical protein
MLCGAVEFISWHSFIARNLILSVLIRLKYSRIEFEQHDMQCNVHINHEFQFISNIDPKHSTQEV